MRKRLLFLALMAVPALCFAQQETQESQQDPQRESQEESPQEPQRGQQDRLRPQEECQFSPDRPGVSTGPGVMHKGGIMWETGFEAGRTDGAWAIVMPSTMFRFGVSDFAEVRLEYDGGLAFNGNRVGYELMPLVLGTKLHLLRGRGAVPEISFMANLAIPITKALCEEFAPAPSLYLLCENPVNDWFGVSYNVGGVWYGQDAIPDAFVALSLNFSPAENWGISVESYNYLGGRDGRFAYSCGLDAGVSYCVLKNLQVDLNGGLNLNTPGSAFSIGCGIAWMIR